MKTWIRAAACGLPLVAAAAANAGISLTQSFTASVATQRTNWVENLVFPKFDPTLGTLTNVTFTISGTVSGSAAFENRDADSATITVNLQARIGLQRPDLTNLVVVIPIATNTETVDAFDGVIDFGGASGRTYTALNSTVTDSSSTSAAVDLALFTASFAGENITLPSFATGESNGSGAGNLTLDFATFGSAEAKVEYTYVPAPGAAALFGLVGLAGARRRR